jgi:hypothetical protein
MKETEFNYIMYKQRVHIRYLYFVANLCKTKGTVLKEMTCILV